MKFFTRSNFERLIGQLHGLEIVPIDENISGFGIVSFRHDIDNDLIAACDMAEAEQECGIRATYFILDTAPYWNDKHMDRALGVIEQKLHYLGWHNNAISNHLRTNKPLKKCISDPLERLRQFAMIIGTASHGDSLCHQHHYLNYYIWQGSKRNDKFPNDKFEQFNLYDFGLKYESYNITTTHYISESGGQWHQDNEAVIKDFRYKVEHGFNARLQVLLHPQHWRL